jgi:hypothetical protein
MAQIMGLVWAGWNADVAILGMAKAFQMGGNVSIMK